MEKTSNNPEKIIIESKAIAGKSVTPLWTPEETAQYLGVTAGTLSVWRATHRYPLPYQRIGRRKVMYDPNAVIAFKESCTVAG